MKMCLLVLMCMTSFQSFGAENTEFPKPLKKAIALENDSFAKEKAEYCVIHKKSCDQGQETDAYLWIERRRQYAIASQVLDYNLEKLEKKKEITPIEHERRNSSFKLNSLYHECFVIKNKNACNPFQSNFQDYARKNYDKEFIPDNKHFVGFVKKSTNQTLAANIKADEKAEGISNIKTSSCVWAKNAPRKIIHLPGCSKESVKACVGYVVCEQKDSDTKFTRLSTCSPDNCGNDSAGACTLQSGYGAENYSENNRISSKQKPYSGAISK
jgi:hypothetical protein